MKQAVLEFFFDGHAVGSFEGSEYPVSEGVYPYMPYRGPGHYEMYQALTATGQCECYYSAGDMWVLFIVRDCPRVGPEGRFFHLADFEKVKRTESATTSLNTRSPAFLEWFSKGTCPDCEQKLLRFDEVASEWEIRRGFRCSACAWTEILIVVPRRRR